MRSAEHRLLLIICVPLLSPVGPSATCTDVFLSYCNDMSYAQTMFPNILGHKTWEETESGAEYLLISVAESLLGGACNPDIRMLGCSVLAPRCEGSVVQKPCRSTCEEVHRRCSHAFEGIEMAWPYFLDCDRFFSGDQETCYDPLEGLRGERRLLQGSGLPCVNRTRAGGAERRRSPHLLSTPSMCLTHHFSSRDSNSCQMSGGGVIIPTFTFISYCS